VRGANPTGAVQFRKDGANIGAPISLDAAGNAISTIGGLGIGAHNFTATYLGDQFNLANTSAPLRVSIYEPSPDTGDIPTAPQWGMILMGLIFSFAIVRKRLPGRSGNL